MPKTAKHRLAVREAGTLKFKPWTPISETKPFLANDALQRMIGVPSRIARVIMSRTKRQLIEAHRKLGDAEVIEMDGILASSVERMQELIEMIEGARARLLVAGCVVLKESVR